jgi:hypothetical protein
MDETKKCPVCGEWEELSYWSEQFNCCLRCDPENQKNCKADEQRDVEQDR